MKLHTDYQKRVFVQSETLPWVASPMAGVHRRMLDRDGEEVARATSLVRYAPNSAFSPHTHGGGEEFLVLEGVFSDEHGDYGPGTYIRNPVGSSHTPSSKAGCIILVKLRQMEEQDQQSVVINSEAIATEVATAKQAQGAAAASWVAGPVTGLEMMPLHSYDTEQVALERWAPGTHFQRPQNGGGEEVFVLAGTLEDEQGVYPKGSWIRSPSTTEALQVSHDGCILYIKTGHLKALMS